MYHKTGRVLLVSAGVFSTTALSAGMWLFTFAAPHFYWFGAPTTFLLGYLLLSCEFPETYITWMAQNPTMGPLVVFWLLQFFQILLGFVDDFAVSPTANSNVLRFGTVSFIRATFFLMPFI